VLRGSAARAPGRFSIPDVDTIEERHRAWEDLSAPRPTRSQFELGFEQGFAEGLEQGCAQAAAEARRDIDSREAGFNRAVAAMQMVAEEAQAVYRSSLAAIEARLIDSALEITEALLQRELELARDPGRDALVRALRVAPERIPVTARLNPEDVATLGDLSPLDSGREITVIADSNVRPADCVLRVGVSEVDASLAAALLRVRAVFEERR
jgi:flagellar assembly protein FliH